MTDPGRKWSPLDEAEWLAGAGAIRIEGKPNDWWLRGPCPGCGHTIDRNISAHIGVAFANETGPRPVTLRCNCGLAHEGRPQDAKPTGCGCAGPVDTAGKSRVRTVSLDPQDVAADEWAEAAVRERLPRLRALATEWQKTVGTVTGLFGLGALFNADSAIRGLDVYQRIGFASMAIVAVLSAGGSILLASLASQPRVVEVPADTAGRWRLWDETFDFTRRRLAWSRRLAGLAVVALLVSFLVRWFG